MCWILKYPNYRSHSGLPDFIGKPEAKVQSKSQIPGLGLSLKSYTTPTHHHPPHPITFWRSGWEYMVQIEAPRTPECQKGIPSQGGQHKEEHRVVHHVKEEHYQGNFKWSWVIEAPSNLEFQGVPSQHGQHSEEHRVGSNRSPKYPWVSGRCQGG